MCLCTVPICSMYVWDKAIKILTSSHRKECFYIKAQDGIAAGVFLSYMYMLLLFTKFESSRDQVLLLLLLYYCARISVWPTWKLATRQAGRLSEFHRCLPIYFTPSERRSRATGEEDYNNKTRRKERKEVDTKINTTMRRRIHTQTTYVHVRPRVHACNAWIEAFRCRSAQSARRSCCLQLPEGFRIVFCASASENKAVTSSIFSLGCR